MLHMYMYMSVCEWVNMSMHAMQKIEMVVRMAVDVKNSGKNNNYKI